MLGGTNSVIQIARNCQNDVVLGAKRRRFDSFGPFEPQNLWPPNIFQWVVLILFEFEPRLKTQSCGNRRRNLGFGGSESGISNWFFGGYTCVKENVWWPQILWLKSSETVTLHYCNPFHAFPRRFYNADRYHVQHFKPRDPRKWYKNPRTVFAVVLLSSGVIITVYFGNLETVPHTNRKHFVLESKEGKWYRDDEILDDKWVQKSRTKGKERGSKPDTGHLEGLNWEALVVDEPVVNAFCLPGGKIVVFTGLLQHFRTDPEIATIIGHEV
ncbi:hypothetical protein ACSBR1_026760 [Camellia fascicularis]